MPRRRYHLIATKLKSLPVGMHADGGGLFLQVTRGVDEELRRSWILRFRSPVTLKRREMGLGRWEVVDLTVARSLADEARRLVPQGIDPIDHRDERKKQAEVDAARAVTFKEAADRCLGSRRAAWKSQKSVQGWNNTIDNYAVPVIGHLPVQKVDVGLVLKILEPVWERKTETARRLRSRIEQVLNWATSRGLRSGPNPARWSGHLENLLASPRKVREVKHHAALHYAKVAALMKVLSKKSGLSARALEFTILNASRTGETIGAKWSEIDLASRTWTIPGSRMKAGRLHRVPLSEHSIRILKGLRKAAPQNEYVFASAENDRPLSNMAMAMMLPHVLNDKITVHGFRSTFRDWAAERTSYAREIAEAALAHTNENKVEAAYRRTDLFEKRRDLMQDWASHCFALDAVSTAAKPQSKKPRRAQPKTARHRARQTPQLPIKRGKS